MPFPIDCNFNWCVDWVFDWSVRWFIFHSSTHHTPAYTRPAPRDHHTTRNTTLIVHLYRCNTVRPPLDTLEVHRHREPHFAPKLLFSIFSSIQSINQSISQISKTNQSYSRPLIYIEVDFLSLSHTHSLSLSVCLVLYICLPFVLPLFDYIK